MSNGRPKSRRGFASAKQKPKAVERGRKGGQKTAAKKTAHQFAKGNEAREAGRKGGLMKAARARTPKTVQAPLPIDDATHGDIPPDTDDDDNPNFV